MALDSTAKEAVKTSALGRIKSECGVVIAQAADEAAFKKAIGIIIEEVYEGIKTYADIDLGASDITVNPGTFTTPSGPVTGAGVNAAVVLGGKIK